MKFYEVSLAKNEKSSNFHKLTSLEYTTTRFSKGLRIYSFLMSEGFSKTRSVMEHIFMIRSIFEETLKRDSRFEVLFYPSKFGLVCFKLRHKSNDELNSFLKEVLNKVNIMIGPYSLKLSSNELLMLRISINSPYITAEEAAILAKKITDVYDSVFN